LQRRGWFVFPRLGTRNHHPAQSRMRAFDPRLQSRTHIAKAVETIGYLLGLRSAFSGRTGVFGGAIPRKDLDLWVLLEPGNQSRCRPVGEQVHRAMGLQV
jgi:hypothetical protein